jgi:hypothetical protein
MNWGWLPGVPGIPVSGMFVQVMGPWAPDDGYWCTRVTITVRGSDIQLLGGQAEAQTLAPSADKHRSPLPTSTPAGMGAIRRWRLTFSCAQRHPRLRVLPERPRTHKVHTLPSRLQRGTPARG